MLRRIASARVATFSIVLVAIMSLLDQSRIAIVVEPTRGPPLDVRLAQSVECPIDLQEKAFWCWAAVGVSLARYYGQAALRQCEMAKRMMGGDCCGAKDCDRPWRLEDVLGDPGEGGLGLLTELHDRALTFDEVVKELGAGRPVALRIELSGGGGHFVAINGVDNATRMVDIGDPDPAFGPQRRAYDVLLTSYRGTWTHSYALEAHAD